MIYRSKKRTFLFSVLIATLFLSYAPPSIAGKDGTTDKASTDLDKTSADLKEDVQVWADFLQAVQHTNERSVVCDQVTQHIQFLQSLPLNGGYQPTGLPPLKRLKKGIINFDVFTERAFKVEQILSFFEWIENNKKDWIKQTEGGAQFTTTHKLLSQSGKEIEFQLMTDPQGNIFIIPQELKLLGEGHTKVGDWIFLYGAGSHIARLHLNEGKFKKSELEKAKERMSREGDILRAFESLSSDQYKGIQKNKGIQKGYGFDAKTNTLYVKKYDQPLTQFIAADRSASQPQFVGNIDSVTKAAVQLAVALSAFHKSGFVHSDIKLDNLFKNGDKIKLADFDWAYHYDTVRSDPHNKRPLAGNYETMAPEIWGRRSFPNTGAPDRDRLLVQAQDVYSFGIVTYAFLKGEVPPIAQECYGEDGHGYRYKYYVSFFSCIQFKIGDVQKKLKDEAKEATDAGLIKKGKLLEMIARCLSYDERERPTMDEVVKELQPAL